jgi:hypothetical protein
MNRHMPASGIRKILGVMTVFSIAMGFLECAVVVYLREIHYPSGFTFPFHPLTGTVALTEILREAATILMLLSLGFLAGRNLRERFAWFLYAFAVWDIFYYIFLKLLIHWPESILTWDILFLIPVMWTGPIIAPLVVSATMILMSLIILHFERKDLRIVLRWHTPALIFAGSILIFTAFVWDFCAFVLTYFSLSDMLHAASSHLILQQYVPVKFIWLLFVSGEVIILAGLYRLFTGYRNAQQNQPKP